jgi:hypothetical protein
MTFRRQAGDRVTYSTAQTARYRSQYLRWLRSFNLQPSIRRSGNLVYFDFSRPRAVYVHTVTYNPALDTRGQPGTDYQYRDCIPTLDRCLEVRATNTYRRVRNEYQLQNGVLLVDSSLPDETSQSTSPWRLICPGDYIYAEISNPSGVVGSVTAPIGLGTVQTTSYTYVDYYYVRVPVGTWQTLAGWGGYRYERNDSTETNRGMDRFFLDAIDLEWRDPDTLAPVASPCTEPLVIRPSGAGQDDGYSCTCPDYTRMERADLRSPYPSRALPRSWTSSAAGAPPPRRCKHIYAAMRARGENPPDPREGITRVVLGWPDLPTTPPDADPFSLIQGLRGRRFARSRADYNRRMLRAQELQDFITAHGPDSLFVRYIADARFQPQFNAPDAMRRLRNDYVDGVFDRITQRELRASRMPAADYGPYPYSRPVTGDEVYRYIYQRLSRLQQQGEEMARRAMLRNLNGDGDE